MRHPIRIELVQVPHEVEHLLVDDRAEFLIAEHSQAVAVSIARSNPHSVVRRTAVLLNVSKVRNASNVFAFDNLLARKNRRPESLHLLLRGRERRAIRLLRLDSTRSPASEIVISGLCLTSSKAR